ncbi:MAG: hypothetical protein COA42_13585 [Alteromonadaceae bacterium]|nr:MAG: hypothetical protein COA42_13585 [Alteromonadaceae bacterium]
MRKLTDRQMLLWITTEIAPDVPVNNVYMTFDIKGAIDIDQFQIAFNQTLKYTDALRTTFHLNSEGIAMQAVAEPFEYKVKLIDLSHDDDPGAALKSQIVIHATNTFDLSKRCFESVLLKLSENHYNWFLCFHHITIDGWSVQILYERLIKAYSEPDVDFYEQTDSNIDYSYYLDYVEKYQTTSRYKQHEQYWKDKLATPLEPLALYGHPPELTDKITRLTLEINEQRSNALKALANIGGGGSLNRGVFQIFATVLYAALHLLSGNKRIGLGVPFHNRPKNLRQICGIIMEICPLIVEFDDDESFDSLMNKVREQTTETMGHARYTTKNPAHARVYEVTLNFFNVKYPDFAGFETTTNFESGLNCVQTAKAGAEQWSVSDSLGVVVNDFNETGAYTLYFDFNEGIFNEEFQQRCMQHFSALLDAFIDCRDTKLNSVNLLSKQERQKLLYDVNPDQDLSEKASVIERLETYAQSKPDNIAAIYLQEKLSYASLNQQVNRLARHLKAAGVQKGVTVGIVMERSLGLLTALLATMKSGGVYIPLDPHHPAERIETILEDGKPQVLLVDSLPCQLNVAPSTQVLLTSDLLAQEAPDDNPLPPLDKTGLAYIIFTSGSTGRPKGVAIPHKALTNFLHSMAERPGMNDADQLLSVTTVSFDIAALELYLPILVGGRVDIASHECSLDPEQLKVRLRHASIFQATPATFQMLLNSDWQGEPSLRILCGGEAFPADLAQLLLQKVQSVWNMYGPTETTIWSLIDKVSAGSTMSIGKPILNTQVYLLNSALTPIPEGCIGEIYIGGAGLAQGYYGRPDLTEAAFIAHPFSDAVGERIYKTGDFGRYLPNGKILCLGRMDSQVKLRGFRIELGEIETALNLQAEVKQCVAVLKGSGDNKHITGYVTLNNDVETTALRCRLKSKLPSYMLPSALIILEELPLTPNGKIDRKQLPEPTDLDLSVAGDLVEASSDSERKILAIWQRALGTEQLSVVDSFFDIGGHSLLAVNVIQYINKACEASLSLSAIFSSPSIRALAKLVDDKSGSLSATDNAVIPLSSGSSDIGLFCICGIDLYQGLANHIDANTPVYGVFLDKETDMWLSANKQNTPTVEELAELYIHAIKKTQAAGPYCLAGLSFGGVLAYEIAQQLTAEGETVKTLALFDSILPRSIKREFSLTLKYHFNRLRGDSVLHLKRGLARRLARLPIIGSKGIDTSASEVDTMANIAFIREQSYIAAIRVYDKVIKPYSGLVRLFCAKNKESLMIGHSIESSCGWNKVTSNLIVHDIEGDHLGLIKDDSAKMIASVISKSMAADVPD